MFKLKAPLTNVRPKSDDATFTLAPTKGVCKISQTAAEAIGIKDGDYVTIAPAEVEINGVNEERFFLYKGKAKDGKEGQLGSKCNYTNGVNGTLQFSSANVYAQMNGDEENNTKYKVHIGLEGESSPIEQDGTTYFMLEFVEKTPKAARKEGEKEEDADADAGNVPEME